MTNRSTADIGDPQDYVVAVDNTTGLAFKAWPGTAYRRYDAMKVTQYKISMANDEADALARANRIEAEMRGTAPRLLEPSTTFPFKPTSINQLKPGHIFIYDGADASLGRCTIPGVVRYVHQGIEKTGAPKGYVAVNLLAAFDEYAANPYTDMAWWDIKLDEISLVVGQAHIEFPRDRRPGRFSLFYYPDDNTKEVEQIPHRIILSPRDSE